MVTLTAVSNTGSTFTGWSGAIATTANPVIVTIDAAKAITASFTLDRHELSITLSGDGSGTVQSALSGIDCGNDCAETYDYGTVVTLTAVAATNSSFTGWSGGTCSGTADCVITIEAAENVIAAFKDELFYVFLPTIIK